MDMGGRVSEMIWIICTKAPLLIQVYACDNGSCEIAVDNHAVVNDFYVDLH